MLDDLEVLKTFEQGIVAFERPFDSTLKDDPISYYDIKEMILSEEVEVVVAVCNNELIGSWYARIETSKIYLKHHQYSYLGFMYVKPEFRGRGVIRSIIDNLKNWSNNRGIHEIRLDVYSENIGAIKAYERSGFKSHLLNMRMNNDL